MKTKKLYTDDMYLKEWEATLISVLTAPAEMEALGARKSEVKTACLALDCTAFFPEGGGQPSDTGFIGPFPVLYVFEKESVVYHQVSLQDGEALVSTALHCSIDWPHRFRNMQRHCGEHILSAAFYELYGGVNRGFHMGDDYMTVDINLEENPEYTEFTEEMMKAAEWESNRYIWEDTAVSIHHFESRKEAASRPMRKALALDEDITLVCVGDESKAAGCVACCGTHPSSCGQVGLIKIYRWESYKGMTRIYFDAGQDALKNYIMLDDVVKALGRKYSTDAFGLQTKLAQQEKKNHEMRQNLHDLKKAFLEERFSELIGACAPEQASSNDKGQPSGSEKLPTPGSGKLPVILKEYPLLKVDDLLLMLRDIPENLKHLLALVSPSENTVLLFCNDSIDCGKIVKDNAQVWNGKGGGKAQSARAMFPSRQDLDCFLDFLRKAY